MLSSILDTQAFRCRLDPALNEMTYAIFTEPLPAHTIQDGIRFAWVSGVQDEAIDGKIWI